MLNVTLKPNGAIYIGRECVTQCEAIDLALELSQAVENSIWRSQKGTPRYHSTEGILERQDAPLGQAILALRKVFR